MFMMPGWLRWIAPWVALGLGIALVVVLLKPDASGDRQDESAAPGQVAAQLPAEPSVAAPTPAPVPQSLPLSYADAVDRSAPAVVNIYTERRVLVPNIGALPPDFGRLFGEVWPDYRERVERSLGSGVIYDDRGHVVTNFHVVERASQINVQLKDGRESPATLVGLDRDTDLAVLKIGLPKPPVIPLGRSDRLRVGDAVLAIGNPIGLGHTVTQGIVSATGRGRLGVSTYENFIQTDAAINFGNSGGALVNASGELVGLNTAIAGRTLDIEGIGFAIPVDLVRGVVDAILRDGRVVRGWIGVVPRDLSPSEIEQFGIPEGSVLVRQVYGGSPAGAQGIARGDVITAINGTRLRGAQDLMARVAMLKPGQGIRLGLWRGPPFEGPVREHSVRIEVVERPAQAAASS
ncbi:MAG TPA: trypsin-like peptidase domain-containing protein [Steroidobacteraceae bacterium]|nr:trypsin-like peptidase domain-containing protein [Steroidobacteraceae bacterium]